MSQDLPLLLCALHSYAFAAFHLAFWRLFGWKRELAKVGLATRAIAQILNLRLVYVLMGIGTACLLFPAELRGTALAGRCCGSWWPSGSAGRSSKSCSCASTMRWCMR